MDFHQLLIEADKNHKLAAKQSKEVKRLNTHFTTPAKKEGKDLQPKAEAIQRFLHGQSKPKEKFTNRESAHISKNREGKLKEQENEKRDNSFRMPKKEMANEAVSDAESFSSISSEEEEVDKEALAKFQANLKASKSSSNSEQNYGVSSRNKHSGKYKENQDKSSSSHSSSHSSKHLSSSSRGKHHHDHTKEKSGHSSSGRVKHSTQEGSSSHNSTSSKPKYESSSSKKEPLRSEADKSKALISSRKDSHSKHKVKFALDNDSSGYITSPNLSSEEEEPARIDRRRESSSSTASSSKPSARRQRNDSVGSNHEEKADAPIALARHHLKPTIERQGCSSDERAKVLAKLQAIKDKMQGSDQGPTRKRAAPGEVKKRRARREKLEGDFSGSCMEKIEVDLEEKPSLKRPEPKPEEFKPEKPKKREKLKPYRPEKEKPIIKKHIKGERRERDSHVASKVNRFDALQEAREKPKIKARPRSQPPPINFAQLMQMAEEQQKKPVMVEVQPKIEKEHRPRTQEEIDRKRAIREHSKTQEHKDWYKFGDAAKEKTAPGKDDSQSGGFLRKDHNVAPKPSPDSLPSSKVSDSSSASTRPSASQGGGFKAQSHPTRPGMIANKPQAMAQHLAERNKEGSKERPASVTRDPKASASSSGGRNAWDDLFSRPEYQQPKASHPGKKRGNVIDSEEEEDYSDMDDFIDDGDDGDMDRKELMGTLRDVFRYDKRKFRDIDDDDRNMEAGFSEVMKEEARSARIGRQEDLEDIRREEEELKRKKALKKMRR